MIRAQCAHKTQSHTLSETYWTCTHTKHKIRTDMRVLNVLYKVAQAGKRDATAIELADVYQKHGHYGLSQLLSGARQTNAEWTEHEVEESAEDHRRTRNTNKTAHNDDHKHAHQPTHTHAQNSCSSSACGISHSAPLTHAHTIAQATMLLRLCVGVRRAAGCVYHVIMMMMSSVRVCISVLDSLDCWWKYLALSLSLSSSSSRSVYALCACTQCRVVVLNGERREW